MLGQSVDSTQGQNEYGRRTYYKTLQEGQLCVMCVCYCVRVCVALTICQKHTLPCGGERTDSH